MSKVNITWNDVNLDSFSNSNKDIIEKIRSLNFIGSENLHFDDIAINYSINGINEIVKFCNMIYKNGVEHLIVWASRNTQNLIQSCLNFVFGQDDFYADEKMKLYFIDGIDELRITKQKLDKYFSLDLNNKMAIVFLDGFIEADEQKIQQIMDLTLSKFNERTSDFLIKKLNYFIGKSEWLKYFIKYQIPKENVFIISSDIHEKFSFFSEICLIILATQGINIHKLVDGYKNNVQNIFSYDLYFNTALKLARFIDQTEFNFKTVEKNKLNHINLFVSYDRFLDSTANLLANLFNYSTLRKNVFCDFTSFPSDISKVGQTVLSNKINKLLIYLNFKQKQFDFQTTSLVNEEDLVSKFEHLSFNELKNISYNVFNDFLLSFNNSVDVLKIDFEKNSEEVFGELISILYWAKIFYCIINNIDPFN